MLSYKIVRLLIIVLLIINIGWGYMFFHMVNKLAPDPIPPPQHIHNHFDLPQPQPLTPQDLEGLHNLPDDMFLPRQPM